MSREGWIRLDTPEAMELFRREHYLFVYTMALDLIGSPLEANRLAEQVLQNTTRRFANRVISQNCDMYLAAQVNLLYSQRYPNAAESAPAPALRETAPMGTDAAGQTAAVPEAQSMPRRMPAMAEMPEPRVSAPLQAKAETAPAWTSGPEAEAKPETPATEGTKPENKSADPLYASENASEVREIIPEIRPAETPQAVAGVVATPTVVPEERVAAIPAPVTTPAAGTAVPEPPAAVAQVNVPAPPIIAKPAAVPPAAVTVPVNPPVAPGVAVPITTMPAQPGTAYTILVSPAVDGSNGMPSVTISAQSGTQSSETPAAPVKEVTAERALEPEDYSTVFNPVDTEEWTPDGAEKARPAARKKALVPPPVTKSYWEEEYEEDKPSIFLTILNGLLTVGSVASIVYLLYQLDVLPKIF